jgi:hypothetical protein
MSYRFAVWLGMYQRRAVILALFTARRASRPNLTPSISERGPSRCLNGRSGASPYQLNFEDELPHHRHRHWHR